jgi:hypothetical protein
MEEVVTPNDGRHNYSKRFKRYLRTTSTKSIRAILRRSRLDAGFFFLSFYPLVRDLWLRQHMQFNNKEFEVLIQLHERQQFTIDDVYDCTVTKKDIINDDWDKKTSLGERMAIDFIRRCIVSKMIRIWKKGGRYNKTIYEFTPNTANEFRRLYDQMLCLTKISTTDKTVVDPVVKKSKAHYKKMIKQNLFKDAFDCELERDLNTSDKEFSVKLKTLLAPK